MKHLWKLWSVKFAALAGTAATLVGSYVVQDPAVVPRIVDAMPEGWKPVAVLAGGFITFALPTLVRAVPQPKLRAAQEAAQEAAGAQAAAVDAMTPQ